MKQKTLKIVNAVLAFAFLLSAASGITHLITPNLVPDEIFSVVHPSLGVTLVLYGLLHVALNWNWVKNAFLSKHRV